MQPGGRPGRHPWLYLLLTLPSLSRKTAPALSDIRLRSTTVILPPKSSSAAGQRPTHRPVASLRLPRHRLPTDVHQAQRAGSHVLSGSRTHRALAGLRPSILRWFGGIYPSTKFDQSSPGRPGFFEFFEPTYSLAVRVCVVFPSAMRHAVLLGCASWMGFNHRSYRSLPPRP